MRRRIYKLLSVSLIACMMFTSSGIGAYAESDGEITAEAEIETVAEEELVEELEEESSEEESAAEEIVDNMDMDSVSINNTGSETSCADELLLSEERTYSTLSTSVNLTQKLNEARNKFPNGKFWNHWGTSNNPDSYTDSHCTNHSGTGNPDCNSFNGRIQCMGYASKIYYDVYGCDILAGNSPLYYSTDEVRAGDFVTINNEGHYVFVIARSGNTITVTECNSNYDAPNNWCRIYWDTTYDITNCGFVNGRHAPNGVTVTTQPVTNTFSYNVIGTTGRGSVSETNATLYAKLSTNVRSGLEVGIQIGTSSGNYNLKTHTEAMSSLGYGQLNSNGEVEVWFECNSELGLTLNRGTKYYYRFIAKHDGKTYYSSENTFTTTGDSTPPTVTSAKITSYDKDGYTVTATASDNVGVTSIKFPSWIAGVTDPIWYEASVGSNGTATCKIKTSDFKNREGTYITDVYAYDAVGNQSNYSRVSVAIDRTAPTISNVKVERISEDTVKVSCKATDPSGVATVAFPTWTNYNGQDDLASDWWNQCKGEKSGDTWTVYVKDANHNYEKTGYVTDIYAKDTYGNQSHASTGWYSIENRFKPTTFTWKRHRYEIYDDLLTWNEAKAKCESLGGHLATITSKEEQDAIANAIQSCVRSAFYLGGEMGEDTWITGEPIEYTNWAEGQPDNSKGVEDVYEIYNVSNKHGKWNDSDRDRLYGRGFICEYEPEDSGDIPEEEIPDAGIPDELWVSGLDTNGYTYTGKSIKPAVKVYNHNKLLKEKVDYTISYKNNTKVYTGEDDAKKPQIIVTGKGNYSGKEYVYFDILPKNIADADVTMDDIVNVYNGKKQNAIPSVVWNGKKLTYNKNALKSDFTVSYSIDGDCIEVGSYVITVEGHGNYTGTKNCNYTIVDNKLISKASVSITGSMPYNGGEPVFPTKLVVKYNKKTLIENEDYSVEYFNNCEIGKATAVITGLNGYSGTKKVTYNITGRKMSNAKVTGIVSKTYNGNAQTQEVSLTYNKEPMTQGEDYTVSYQKNVNAGTATIVFTGINGYTGALKKTYKINPYSIKNNPDGYFANDGSDISVQYVKAGAKPDVTVTFKGKTLVKGVDYTLSYKNNTAVNDGTNPQKLPTITIKGKGNFKDSVTKTFAITPGDLGRDGVKMKAADKVYKKQKNAYKSTPVLYDTNGKKLAAGTDYSKKYVYRYNDKNGAVIGTNEIPEAGSIIYVEAAGIKNYEGSTIGTTYRIVKQGISAAKVSVENQTYTGKAITITKDDIKSIKIGKTALTADDYEIVPNSYKNNIKKGTASVSIRGLGNYGGEKSITFKIKAKSLLFDWSWLFG